MKAWTPALSLEGRRNATQSANWGQLGPNWRAGSVKAGPLWFVYGGQDGYAHVGRFLSQARSVPARAKAIGGVMIIEVADGPAATIHRSGPGGAGRSLGLGVPPAALADLHGAKSQEPGIAG